MVADELARWVVAWPSQPEVSNVGQTPGVPLA
jgi:hypothetical protein